MICSRPRQQSNIYCHDDETVRPPRRSTELGASPLADDDVCKVNQSLSRIVPRHYSYMHILEYSYCLYDEKLFITAAAKVM